MKHFYQEDCLLNAVSMGRFNEKSGSVFTRLRYVNSMQNKEKIYADPF